MAAYEGTVTEIDPPVATVTLQEGNEKENKEASDNNILRACARPIGHIAGCNIAVGTCSHRRRESGIPITVLVIDSDKPAGS